MNKFGTKEIRERVCNGAISINHLKQKTKQKTLVGYIPLVDRWLCRSESVKLQALVFLSFFLTFHGSIQRNFVTDSLRKKLNGTITKSSVGLF